ncbi:very short patch repair endonuclease [Pontibacter burrus]|uniref:Very short patch repair endonuclease n=1 Tax=Pontibacter burrus TaxID=2704466 RepID=A0A6B3LXZ5_9BACT|nr:DNA mismatch endonuclease Vsr [Pontibacter burrus]NEM98351.1 DNA mismatch endonuclease Vsr [Pontibacter burrus]
MADNISEKSRSFIMSRVKSKNTKPELLVRKYLFSQGYRFRLHKKELPGTPDVILPKYKIAIFVNGCFWHDHNIGCRSIRYPKSNADYWIKKITRTKERDRRNISDLTSLGWKVIVVWECKLKKKELEITLKELVQNIEV